MSTFYLVHALPLLKVIYDLLIKNSGPLELREDPDQVCA